MRPGKGSPIGIGGYRGVDSSCCRRRRPQMARPREKEAPNRSHSLVQPKGGQCTHKQAAGSGSAEQFHFLKKGKGGERLQMLAWLPELRLPRSRNNFLPGPGGSAGSDQLRLQALVPRAWPLATIATPASLLQASAHSSGGRKSSGLEVQVLTKLPTNFITSHWLQSSGPRKIF